jgi:hypothetical protein
MPVIVSIGAAQCETQGMGMHRRVRRSWPTPALVFALAAGCGHLAGDAVADDGRVATFAQMARGLPRCPSGLAAMTVEEAAGKRWISGECDLVRGWLALVRDPPPCSEQLASDPAALPGDHPNPGACGIGWILSSGPPPGGDGPAGRPVQPRIGLANPINDGGLAACEAGYEALSSAPSPFLINPRDQRDLDAARRAFPALEVVMLGGIHSFPTSEELGLMIGRPPPTATVHERALEVSSACRVDGVAQ